MKLAQVLLIPYLLILTGSRSFSQERPIHEVYSMMIFNFIKYTQWPENEPKTEFVIGVVGNSDVYATMTASYGHKPFRGNKTIEIRKFKNASEVTDCEVVFIDKSKSAEFEAILEKVKGKGTLIITDYRGLGARGSCINFRVVDGKLQFEINKRAVESANLKLASALISMAILI